MNSNNSLSKTKVFQSFQDEPSLIFPFLSIVENEPEKCVIVDIFGDTDPSLFPSILNLYTKLSGRPEIGHSRIEG